MKFIPWYFILLDVVINGISLLKFSQIVHCSCIEAQLILVCQSYTLQLFSIYKLALILLLYFLGNFQDVIWIELFYFLLSNVGDLYK